MFHIHLYKVLCLLLLCLVLGADSAYAAEKGPWLRSGKDLALGPSSIALATPAGIKARASLVGAITVSWNAVPTATQYVIEYAGKADGIFRELTVVNAPKLSYRHTGLSYDQTVYYRVKAVNGSTSSAFSSSVAGKTNSKGQTFRIMPLGDSNTKGSSSSLPEVPQNEPYMYGYRKALYKLLTGAAVPFDYVGSEKSGSASSEFSDYDHAGFGGARIGDIGDLLEFGWYSYYEGTTKRGPGGGTYLDKYNPDIVLLHIGTNWVDPYESTVTDSLQRILNQIDAYEARANKEVTVVLARIIKRCQDCTDEEPKNPDYQNESTRIYNERLWTLAGERIAKGDRLLRVDMETGAGLNYYREQGNDILDYLHLTEAGYAKMAKVWFGALKDDLTVTPPPLDTKAPETTIVSKPDAVTNKRTATFSFSSNEQDVVYQLSRDGGEFQLTSNPRSFENLTDGTYTIAVRAVDLMGNIDATPATFTWIVDTKAPAAPAIASPVNNDLLNNSKPAFSGTAEALSMVTVQVDGVTIGTAKADAAGKWSLTAGTALSEGSKKASATATDAAGNISAASSIVSFTLDLTPPAAPAILAISEDTGSQSDDKITQDQTLRFTGSADAGVLITLSETTLGVIGTATAANNGAWEYNFEGTTLAEKTYTFKATAEDKAGNKSSASSNFVVRVDKTAPAGYTAQFTTAKVDLTNMKNVDLQVRKAETGASYFYSISSSNGGDEVAGSAIASAADFLIKDLDVSGLRDGELTLQFYLVDVAGNRGATTTSTATKVTKDIVAVKELDKVQVAFKTPFSGLPLPSEVEVTYSDNAKEMLPINWQQGNYNGEVPATYQLIGTLTLKPNTSNSGNRTATLIVEVEPNKPPTAVSLSSTTFQPDITPEEAIGTFTTTDPDDDEHTYALINGEGDADNKLFEIRGNELYLITDTGLSGEKEFSIRISTTDAYENVLEQVFKLKKEPYKKKIELVNAFTPDGDGFNDTWIIPELKYFDSIELQVFDRTGTRLFHTTDPENGWDGRNTKGEVQQGAYFYILNVKDTGLVQKGVVTVIN